MSQQIIPSGLYFGWTLPELEARLIALKTEVSSSGNRLTGSTVNGQTFQFSDRREGGTLEEQLWELQAALHFLAPAKYPPPVSRGVAMKLT